MSIKSQKSVDSFAKKCIIRPVKGCGRSPRPTSRKTHVPRPNSDARQCQLKRRGAPRLATFGLAHAFPGTPRRTRRASPPRHSAARQTPASRAESFSVRRRANFFLKFSVQMIPSAIQPFRARSNSAAASDSASRLTSPSPNVSSSPSRRTTRPSMTTVRTSAGVAA